MRFLKSNPIFSLVNSYLIDSPQPANISYMWNFGSLLGICLIIQILTGVFLAMHYTPNVELAFISVEHIMRDVNSGWFLRYTHANVASFFFLFLYFHTARGLYYSSYKTPRVLLWSIGVIILILTMAKDWPNLPFFYKYFSYLNFSPFGLYNLHLYLTILPFSKKRVRANYRIGPHPIDILSILICGLLGNWWGNVQKNKHYYTYTFYLEQSIKNASYIHQLNQYLFDNGYCSSETPKLIQKSEFYSTLSVKPANENRVERWNYRLTMLSFTSLEWIYDGFYPLAPAANHLSSPSGYFASAAKEGCYITSNVKLQGCVTKNLSVITRKRVPLWIEIFITPLGLAHWIMQDGSRQKGQGISIATNSFTYEECKFLANILNNKFGLKTSVVKTGKPNQWRISIWKESMHLLVRITIPYIIEEMKYKFEGFL